MRSTCVTLGAKSDTSMDEKRKERERTGSIVKCHKKRKCLTKRAGWRLSVAISPSQIVWLWIRCKKKKNTMILQGSLHRANNVQSCPQVCPSALTGHRGVRRWRNCLCFEKSRNLVKRWSIPENTSWLVPNRHPLHTLWLPVQRTLRKQTFTRFLCKVLGFVRRKKTHTSALKVPHSKTSNTSEALFSSPHVCDVQIR